MRLPVPFVRLPLLVDASVLAAEVDALDASSWRDHPENAPGNTAVPLVAVDGDPTNDETRGAMLPTPHLDALPYTRSILHALGSVIGRSRLMRIEEEGELDPHVDMNYYWRDHLRVHVPVLTTPEVRFECDGVDVHMAAGEVWVFDTWRRHRVTNPALAPRIHLVVDTVGSGSLWDLVERPDQPVRSVDPASPDLGPVPTEAVNYPRVMSPWELDAALDALVAELATLTPGVAAALTDALRGPRHDWRQAWARYGESPEGVYTYLAVRQAIDDTVVRLAGAERLPNRTQFVEAVRQLALGPAIAPVPVASARAAHAPSVTGAIPSAQTAREPTRIERPIVVVSSPRSGSTLLFETLARAPGLFTIGGESHRVIESIPGLEPAAHDWDSNRLVADDATPAAISALQRAFVVELRDRDGGPPSNAVARLLEKTPKNSLRVPFLAAAFPDASFVYLYRDPRETVSSMLDAWRSGRFVTYPRLPDWDGPPWSLLLVPGWRELSGRSLAEIVTAQWATATEVLLDDLEAIDADRWCVASYDRLVADPQAEVARLCEFLGLDWDVDLSGPLPDSRHTLDSPHPEKWRRNADELEPHWERVREVASRAHDVFAAPPRVRPVRPSASAAPSSSAPVAAEQSAPPPTGTEAGEGVPFRSVHTASFAELLTQYGSSALVSTYQSGRVIAVRADDGRINTHFRAFASPMGMCVRGGLLAIGTKTDVHIFQNQPAVTSRLETPGHDACFMPRHAYTTGDVRIHDLAFAGDELWLVNTRFSCLATLDGSHSFVPRWRPPFISALSPEDRCHLNGLAVVDDRPAYVTALGLTDVPAGWREDKVQGGAVIDVASGEPVVTGLCMPHSPRWHADRLWVLESGRGSLGVVDVESGAIEEVGRVPGFARGLAFLGPYALIGLSQVREQLFDGLPLTAEGVERNCGVWVLDTRNGDIVGMLRFEGVVEEIFEVTVLPGIRKPEIVEPGAELVESSFVVPDAALADVPEALTLKAAPPPE